MTLSATSGFVAHLGGSSANIAVALARHGHAMAIPTPGSRGHPALAALADAPHDRLHFAHSDLSAYSVFEEAFAHGHRAGLRVAQALSGR